MNEWITDRRPTASDATIGMEEVYVPAGETMALRHYREVMPGQRWMPVVLDWQHASHDHIASSKDCHL